MEPNLPYRLDRTLIIGAAPDTVFRYFTDSARFANWWGAGSTIDAQPGGKVYIKHPGGVETVGEVLEVSPPAKIVFTYGYASGRPIPAGGSRVTIELEAVPGGTRLALTHELPDQTVRDEHVQGWRFQLSLFANVVADEVFAERGTGLVDAWFAAWAVESDAGRAAAFAEICDPAVQMRDRYSALIGLAEVVAHAGAAQRFMPGITIKRTSEPRHCQGVVLADWAAAGPDGITRMSGTNVFQLGLTGRLSCVTGLAR